jgi:hypothetical protein
VVRLLSGVCRGGFALAVFLIVLAVSRWGPVYAEPPLDVRALPLALPAVVLAVGAALTGRERRPRPWRAVLAALAFATLALFAVALIRPPAGLSAQVEGPEGPVGRLPPGPIDLLGRDVRKLPGLRRVTLRWEGPLVVPESGTYRIWAAGRGRVEVRIGERRVLVADADPLHASAPVLLGRGPQVLEVRLDWRGPGPRLRLGWTRTDGRHEVIPPRALGPPGPRWPWVVTDVLAVLVAALAGALVLTVPWDRPKPLPAPRRVTAGEIVVSVAGYGALLAVMSWPLVRDLAGAGPIDRPDGRLNAWILAWDAHALLHEPARLFQAPIFHPLPDALAFSENLLLLAVAGAPALLAGEPVLAYNLVLLFCLVLSGLGAQLLVRRASGDRLAAWVGGACFAAGAYRWTRLAHLHAQATLLLPFALLALDRFWERRTLRRALLVGLALALQGLASVYLGAVTATAVAVAIAVGIFGGLGARELLRLAAGFLLAGLLLLPAVRPYLRMRAFQGVEFTLETVSIYATSLASYAASGNRLWGPISERHIDPEQFRDALFPGLAVIALGIAGLARAPRRFRAVAIAASAVAVVLSLGPETGVYRFLHENLVFLRGVRALGRFAVLPWLALTVLAGFCLAGRRWFVSLGALALVMLESTNVPLRLGPYGGPPTYARWLAGKTGAVAVLPLGMDDTQAMLDGIAHFLPLLNGDSGFMPRPYDRAMELLAREPLGDEGFRFLRAVGVTSVVARGPIEARQVADLDGRRIYEVPPGEVAHVAERGEPTATRWDHEGVLVDLGHPRSIAGVVFEIEDSEWVDRPLVRVSTDGQAWEGVPAEASLPDAVLSLYHDPRAGRGVVRFSPRSARFVRLDPRLPARPGLLEALP